MLLSQREEQGFSILVMTYPIHLKTEIPKQRTQERRVSIAVVFRIIKGHFHFQEQTSGLDPGSDFHIMTMTISR